jgi:hypothetical protein
VTDQTSIIHFIEDNWLGGQRLGSHGDNEMMHPFDLVRS